MICVCKCPSCGDEMMYDMNEHVLVCNTCLSKIDTDDYDYSYIDYSDGNEISEGVYESKCPTCGSIVYVNNTDIHVACSHCRSELSVFTATKDQILPEKVIPFSLNEAQANIKLENWWNMHDTMPKLNRERLKMTFSPVYVPVWLYDAEAYIIMDATVAPDEVSQDDIGVGTRTQGLHMGVSMQYHKVPFDGSAVIREDRFLGIEPYDYSEMKDFNAGYLTGINAERYYYSHEDLIPRLLTRLQKDTIHHCEESIEADKCGGLIKDRTIIDLSIIPKKVIYGFVPVWICSYVYKENKHQIYINGQTGKVDGQALVANSKFARDIMTFGICSMAAFSTLSMELSLMLNSPRVAEFVRDVRIRSYYYFFPFVTCLVFLIVLNYDVKHYFKKDNKSTVGIHINEEIQIKQGKIMELAPSCFMRIAVAVIALIFISSRYMNSYSGINDIGAVIIGAVGAVFLTFFDIFFFAKKRYSQIKRREIVEVYQYTDMFHFETFENWLL